MRTRDFASVFPLCYGRSGEEICTGYAMAASGRMQYDYKQTNTLDYLRLLQLSALKALWSINVRLRHPWSLDWSNLMIGIPNRKCNKSKKPGM